MDNTMKRKPSFRIVTMVLLAATFMLGGVAGAFMYATGEEVVTSTWMQMISHTEYRYGESGQIIARLVDYQGNPVVVDNCTATILYPDKTYFVDSQLMTESGNISGDHYYSFTTPSGPEGVYEYQATCYYQMGAQTRNKSVTNSFHLSSAFNNITQKLSVIQSDISAINVSLGDDLDDINQTLQFMESVLLDVNTTTTNTYQYLTGTLTNSVDQILTDLGVINATVNRIETNTVAINGTVNQILTNQENEVFMTTFSG